MFKPLSLGVLFIALPALAQSGGDPVKEPKHLTDARALVKAIDLSRTSYVLGKSDVTFTGRVASNADCSGFVDALFKYSYGYEEDQFKKWFGSKRPTAARYHDAIEAEKGFTQILKPQDARAGDLLAIKYFERTDNTGHIMVVAAAPQRMAASKPLVAGTDQWQVRIYDSSHTGHELTDTRHAKGKNSKDHDGLGEGIFRIYTDKQGKIAGYAWSTVGASKFAEPAKEHLVIGRLKDGYKP